MSYKGLRTVLISSSNFNHLRMVKRLLYNKERNKGANAQGCQMDWIKSNQVHTGFGPYKLAYVSQFHKWTRYLWSKFSLQWTGLVCKFNFFFFQGLLKTSTCLHVSQIDPIGPMSLVFNSPVHSSVSKFLKKFQLHCRKCEQKILQILDEESYKCIFLKGTNKMK